MSRHRSGTNITERRRLLSRRRFIHAAALLPLAAVLPHKPAKAEETESLTIWVATDLHYLSPLLTDGGEIFRRLMNTGDGKLTERTPEILDALISRALAERPDALILCGDITFNGELISLREVAEKLTFLRDAGIPVLVIPGNHDIGNSYARSYFGNAAGQTPAATEEDFRTVCAGLGPEQAVSRDERTFSYCCELNGSTAVLCLDANTVRMRDRIPSDTLKWAEECLTRAKEKGMTVISVTHQNVLPQSTLLAENFVIANTEQVLPVLARGGVTVNLSGHSHIQHTARSGSMTDCCTGSLSVAPLRYAVLTVSGGRITYHPESIGLFREEAAERFDGITERRVRASLEKGGYPEAVIGMMTNFSVRVNALYFAGELTPVLQAELLADEGYRAWKDFAADSFWFLYLTEILTERLTV